MSSYWDFLPLELQQYILHLRDHDSEHVALTLAKLQCKYQKIVLKLKKIRSKQYHLERSQRRQYILRHWSQLTNQLNWPLLWKDLWKQYFESHPALDWFYEQDRQCTTFFMFTSEFVAPGHQWPEEMKKCVLISRCLHKNIFELRVGPAITLERATACSAQWLQICDKEKQMNLE